MYMMIERDCNCIEQKIKRLSDFKSFASTTSLCGPIELGYFATLPLRTINKIFSNCGGRELLKLGCTCQTFRRMCSSDALWKNVLSEFQLAAAKKAKFDCLKNFVLATKVRVPSNELKTFTGYGFVYNEKEPQSRYCGHLVNGVKDGQGVISDGECVYYGGFVAGLRDGFGVTEWADGKRHEGEYRGGQRNGKGTFTWPNGHCYIGEFKDDKRSGNGVFRFSDGSEWVGEFRDNERYFGTYTWPVSKRKYSGFWDRSRRHGHGTYWWPDGTVYEGDWENDMRSGQGTLRYADGSSFRGVWTMSHRSIGIFDTGKYIFSQVWRERVLTRENTGIPVDVDVKSLAVGTVVEGIDCTSTLIEIKEENV